ncbi:hypothetical protein SDRG_08776 [Saprolegnia diclina VS20]|uniref:Cilia- and flagella-associated protein 53 n=1 Tax=Saprolegnia diclina (strain VS20) TaxID=1156394 RepID=T0RTM3_SAPDV|nr:hypothetical protein SDRG_08776 [Saprolegnia diclina VS20]EQC33672.1 hypothetical protein SDRG_08776 [Saprolegnia diclina VS20]|eukprot:XP_008612895.1 hypothetical protein SDRG_08776 [Saprolegnia diclina VS20]
MQPRTSARGAGEGTIMKRRLREDSLAMYSNVVKGFAHLNSRADWETKAHEQNGQRQTQRVVGMLQNQDESALQSRRLKLAALYNAELEQWKAMCLANVETPEERKAKMIARATELKAKREAARVAYVEEKRLQQYREGCDDIRTVDSATVMAEVVAERERQLAALADRQKEEAAYEAQMAALWAEDIAKKDARERRDRDRIVEGNAAVKAILDVQVDHFKARVADETRVKEQEDDELLREWARHAQVEAELEAARHRDALDRARDVKAFNKRRSEMSRRDLDRERDYDAQLLHLALRNEAEAEQREKDQQERFKQDQLAYQAMLRRQMEAEKEDLSHLDVIRKQMEDEVWRKRDEEHAAEQAARDELLAHVLASRNDQMARKAAAKRQSAADDAAFMAAVTREADEALQKELDEQEVRRRDAKRNQADLATQKQQTRVQNESAKQREFLDMKRMALAEKTHQKKMEALSHVDRHANHRRKTAEWYYDT